MRRRVKAQLVGGPYDGEIIHMPDLRPHWRMPMRQRPTTLREPDSVEPNLTIAEYALILHDGRPSVDIYGQYRLRFVRYE